MELANNESGEIQDKLLGDLLRTDRVQWLLQRMDDFGPIEHIDSGVLSKLHGIKPMCLENVVARLLELGLRTGVSVFDEQPACGRATLGSVVASSYGTQVYLVSENLALHGAIQDCRWNVSHSTFIPGGIEDGGLLRPWELHGFRGQS
jgi:hypothetical protein